jgi:hypothetical protein
MNQPDSREKRRTFYQRTIYSATIFLEKCRNVVLEKWFCKLGFFFSGSRKVVDQKKSGFILHPSLQSLVNTKIIPAP